MPGKTTRRTGQPRVVYLTPAVVELCKQLARHNRDGGPLFRNRAGEPWGRQGIDYRFQQVAKELKLPGLASYTLRHSFCTHALLRGVDVATVATLMGHTSTRIVMKHYNHLRDQIEHMKAEAQKAAGGAIDLLPDFTAGQAR